MVVDEKEDRFVDEHYLIYFLYNYLRSLFLQKNMECEEENSIAHGRMSQTESIPASTSVVDAKAWLDPS